MPQLSMTRRPGITEIPIVSPGQPWRFPYVRDTRMGDDSQPRWTENTRRYSENRRGWLTAPIRVSRKYGNRNGWPGDTIGISVLPGRRVMLSWGIPSSATAGQIWAAPVRHA